MSLSYINSIYLFLIIINGIVQQEDIVQQNAIFSTVQQHDYGLEAQANLGATPKNNGCVSRNFRTPNFWK